jgi:hypothetical protein
MEANQSPSPWTGRTEVLPADPSIPLEMAEALAHGKTAADRLMSKLFA